MTENIIHFGRRQDGSPALSIGVHPDDAERALVVSAWGQPISLNAMEAADLLDFLAKYRTAIFALAEKHEQNRRYALLQEIESLAKAQNVWINLEDGLIDLVPQGGGGATSLKASVKGFEQALSWLKARQPESEQSNG